MLHKKYLFGTPATQSAKRQALRIYETKVLKTTKYFDAMRLRVDRAGIKDEWIQQVVENPDESEIQADGRIRKWGKIIEAEGRYLRVVVLENGETIHNAFFDRRFQQ